ncbi:MULTISPECIES: iron-containing redox enzyme family protein [unclassified Streptomyces]|uniref:iron-containing redox enzyme family protein n=1 Tax=unclassified Streptomyces TaxID=2593676 RepID=UPI0022567C80|nr:MULTISPECIES: iron-containing redox enzyme family protein [unclassified Streptomyces]MCX5152085.1 iron-containing redox enzyme family protein [Streptomyces sp. NBC_00320]WSN46490.1 iron-containing redox enzyme family protein [Streptomyces sp. NBC_01296]
MTPPGPSTTATATGPRLVEGRGALSDAVTQALRSGGSPVYAPASVLKCDPWGEDLQLSLYLLYELHYRGFDGVEDAREWDPDLLRLRQDMEVRFLHALRTELSDGPRSVEDAFAPLLVEPVDLSDSLSHRLESDGQLWQLREYAALRSLYHLKEADPHAWVIPRLTGRAKAAMVAIEYDEFGAGRADRIHAGLFADLMTDLDLDPAYGRYLDQAPAALLATVNLMSLFGLHRALRGALVGHFACVEVTSSPGSRRMANAMRRCAAGPAAEHFYAEHVEADAVHEQLVRHEVIGGLLADEPGLEADVAFGCAATVLLEDRLAAHLRGAWDHGRSALRTALPEP